MIIDGEKYACEACVRGHRVSNCNHYERPLQHINKKGRPVSQCPHCRGLRKARSSHVKCECGDKVRKTGSVSPTKRCACGQGARCTCAHKKDHLMPYDEIKKVGGLHRSRSHTDAHKPRLSSPMYADPNMTVFQNGHHKPVHHRNHAGHERGLPYKIPSRPHSIHGHSSLARASTDSLPLLSDYSPYPYEFVVSSEDMVHSAHNSPALKPKVDLLNQLPQLDLSYGALNTDISSVTSSPQPEEYHHQQPTYRSTYFTNVDSAPMSAMSGGAPVDLSALGLQAFGNDYTQSTAYGGYDVQRLGTPEISDTEDFAGANSPAFYADSPYLAPQDAAAVMGTYNVNVSSDPMGSGLTPPSSMPNNSGLTGTSMGPLMGAGGVGSPIPSIPQLSPDLEDNYHYSLDAQKMSHPAISRESSVMPSSPPQPFRPTSDPTWGHFPDEQAFLPSNDGVYQAQPTWTH